MTAKLGMALDEALENLTLGEVAAIERHYGRSVDEFTTTEATTGVVWAYERRRWLAEGPAGADRADGVKRPEWADIEAWTFRDALDYCEPEQPEVDPEEPETEQGKDDSAAE